MKNVYGFIVVFCLAVLCGEGDCVNCFVVKVIAAIVMYVCYRLAERRFTDEELDDEV